MLSLITFSSEALTGCQNSLFDKNLRRELGLTITSSLCGQLRSVRPHHNSHQVTSLHLIILHHSTSLLLITLHIEMKFAQELGAHITPEWRSQYIQYEKQERLPIPTLHSGLNGGVARQKIHGPALTVLLQYTSQLLHFELTKFQHQHYRRINSIISFISIKNQGFIIHITCTL